MSAHDTEPMPPAPRAVRPAPHGPATRLAALATIVVLLVLGGAGLAAAADGVDATATLDGRVLAGANASDPVRFDPHRPAQIVVELTNGTGAPVTVRRVDLTGHVLGLNFFSYSTAVEMTVAAGDTETLTYRLDPAGLDGQATGLIGTTLTVIGGDGEPVATVSTVVDVRGSLFSVYGLFGIVLAVLTALAIADAALTVARHRLSANRWQRGLRLLAPGVGVALMIGFTASVARWWVPATPLWLALAGATATVFFLTGYFSPTPEQPDDLDLDPADLAAARELDAHGYGTVEPVGHAQPFGPSVSADSAVGGADARRRTGPRPSWYDPSEEPTVSVRSPHGRGPGGTLHDVGGTLPDLPGPNRADMATSTTEVAGRTAWGTDETTVGTEPDPGVGRREPAVVTDPDSTATVRRGPSGDVAGSSGQGDGR
ncbi:hypothetical protein [Nocardia otitidiscaviarum]|uniref:hypothetical protein n=1 Tax=Nocardia otitidiscaviarum TaxID=1823 RepID=UPI00189418D9|nr:hypothetical protein [Nocardia otitidiscaviarum]MBF6182011.1 hypothetical protein [Nocardia otitidiscaviarum]